MNIVNEIGMAAMMGQLAEECAELGKAALKYQRILLDKNPTPVTTEQALADIREEANDVTDCLALLRNAGVEVSDYEQSVTKLHRWETRIREHKEQAK